MSRERKLEEERQQLHASYKKQTSAFEAAANAKLSQAA